MKRATFAVGFVAAGVLLWPATGRAAGRAIDTKDNAFAPSTTTVSVGDTVTWTNSGGLPHEVTASNGSFKSGNLDPGESYRFTATTAGSFGYVCRYHETSNMKGTLVVRAASTGVGVPAHPQTGGDRVLLGTAILGVALVAGFGLRAARGGTR